MSDWVFAAPVQPSVAVLGTAQRYPVRRIFCVARNYAAHAREMGADPERELPFYFSKNPVHLLPSGSAMAYPQGTQSLHYEMELVVALGQSVPVQATQAQAAAAVWGCACGLDMTRRDLQNQAKAAGRPWDLAKDFEQSAVLGALQPVGVQGVPQTGGIRLSVNGQVRQLADLSDMIWSVSEIIANLSAYYHLQAGDLIYTGTPEGVGAVQPGDVLQGEIEGLGQIQLRIDPAA